MKVLDAILPLINNPNPIIDAGKEFTATNQSINNNGWLEAYSDGAYEDLINNLQNKLLLGLGKD